MTEPIRVAVLGRLAVDRTLHGQGIGRALLRDGVLRTLEAADVIGVGALRVRGISTNAQRFHLACGFTPSAIAPMVLTATLQDLAAVL